MTRTSRSLENRLKRAADFILAFLALCFFAPALALIAIAIRLRLGSPVLFVQTRPGLNEVPFQILKFRTMSYARDERGLLLSDDRRLDRFGKLIRSTSLDEIPQLLNVLNGKMSLVGPRPLLMEYLPLYSERQKLRHKVRPGITGYAQVNGRNETDWTKRLELDVWYVENWSLLLDFKILLATVATVLLRRGIYQSGRATVDRFQGTQDS